MRRIVKISWLGAFSMSVVLQAANVGQAESKPPATIVSPQVNTIVGRLAEVVCETTAPGVPLVLVAAEEETVEWWVQPLAKTTGPGRYTVAAHFGNSRTPHGKPFQVMVMLAPSERVAEVMVKQQVFTQLPTGLVMSKPVRVLRKVEGATAIGQATTSTAARNTSTTATTPVATPDAVEIVRIENRARVARRQELHGTLRGPIDPVILVRSATDSMWWVQESVRRNAAGEFTALVRFGNEETAAGSEFQMVALTPRSNSEAALFNVGDSLKELPKDAIVSTMTFVLGADEATDAE